MLNEQSRLIIASTKKFQTTGSDAAILPGNRTIVPGDQLIAQVWLRDKTTQFRGYPFQQTVPSSGEIFIPDVGAVIVAGKTVAEMKALISDHFSRILKDPTILLERISKLEPTLSPATALSLTADRQAILLIPHVVIMGRVTAPGIYPLEQGLTVRDALAQSGQIDEFADTKRIYIVRGSLTKPEVVRINLNRIQRGNDLAQNYLLQPNDAIYVPAVRMWVAYDYIRTALLPITAVRDAVWVGTSAVVK